MFQDDRVTSLTNERMLLQDLSRSLLDAELVLATMLPSNCKGRSDGGDPECSREEEQYSDNRVIRPFRLSRSHLVQITER